MEPTVEQSSELDQRTTTLSNGPMESRQDMVQALLMMNALSEDDQLEFFHVILEGDRYHIPCPESQNGSLYFVANTENPPGTYYDFPGPGLEHSSQDHFPYIVDELFYLETSHELQLELSAIEQGENGYYTDQSIPKSLVTVTQHPEWGVIVKLNNRHFIAKTTYDLLDDPDCPEYQP